MGFVFGFCVCVLFEKGIDAGVWRGTGCAWVCTNARACRGVSPLLAASEGGHLSCVEALIHANANVLECNK